MQIPPLALLREVAAEAAKRARLDAEALCGTLKLKFEGDQTSVDVFKFIAERYSWHYAAIAAERLQLDS